MGICDLPLLSTFQKFLSRDSYFHQHRCLLSSFSLEVVAIHPLRDVSSPQLSFLFGLRFGFFLLVNSAGSLSGQLSCCAFSLDCKFLGKHFFFAMCSATSSSHCSFLCWIFPKKTISPYSITLLQASADCLSATTSPSLSLIATCSPLQPSCILFICKLLFWKAFRLQAHHQLHSLRSDFLVILPSTRLNLGCNPPRHLIFKCLHLGVSFSFSSSSSSEVSSFKTSLASNIFFSSGIFCSSVSSSNVSSLLASIPLTSPFHLASFSTIVSPHPPFPFPLASSFIVHHLLQRLHKTYIHILCSNIISFGQ